jgi:hypothetical protein
MRALLVVSLSLLAPLPFVVGVGCKDEPSTAGDAATSVSASASATDAGPPVDAGPHTYGDLTEEEITDALKRKRVIAIVRPKSMKREDVGTKNEAIRYELDLVKPLNGSPPSECMQRGAEAQMAPGRVYAVVIDRAYMRLLIRAVEVQEDKLKDVATALEASITKIAPIVAASASADDADDDDAPPSGSTSASTKPSASASAKPSASASAKPSVTASAKPPASMTAGTPPKPTASTSVKPK